MFTMSKCDTDIDIDRTTAVLLYPLPNTMHEDNEVCIPHISTWEHLVSVDEHTNSKQGSVL